MTRALFIFLHASYTLSTMTTALSNNQKRMIGVLFAMIFLNSNITAINSGGCASSPCGGVEVSGSVDSGVNDSRERNDVYLFTTSNPILAPTTLLLLVLPVDREVGYSFAMGQAGLQIAIDSLNESGWRADQLQERDRAWNRSMYFVVKAITLLSLVIWYFVFRALSKNKKIFATVFIMTTLLLLVNSFFTLATLYAVADMGATTLTWNVIFE